MYRQCKNLLLFIVYVFTVAFSNTNVIHGSVNCTYENADAQEFLDDDSVLTKVQSNCTKIQAQNITKQYEENLSKIKSYCLTKQEYEKFYGNKSPYSLVFQFAPLLIDETSKQIGLNELRSIFNLQPQRCDYINKIEEQPIKIKKNVSKDFSRNLKYFQNEAFKFLTETSAVKFWPTEIDVAEKFLDQKFPQIRKIYKLKFEEAALKNTNLFEKNTIDQMLKIFYSTSSDIRDTVRIMNKQSYDGFILPKSKLNYCNQI